MRKGMKQAKGLMGQGGDRFLNQLRQFAEDAVCKHFDWPTDLLHAMVLIGEEVGEAQQAAFNMQYNDGDVLAVKRELYHVAAAAMLCIVNMEEG